MRKVSNNKLVHTRANGCIPVGEIDYVVKEEGSPSGSGEASAEKLTSVG